MIEIYLSENYDKNLLKAELKWIKETASRELTYDVNRNPNLDVHVSPFRYTKDEVKEWSTSSIWRWYTCIYSGYVDIWIP